MFRITTQTSDDGLVMKLEGCLIGPWVDELDVTWREALSTAKGRPVRVDLSAVCHVDATGRRLMALMYQAGAQFVARGCVMPELVREISAAGTTNVRPPRS
jgi:anti-anti-sigma regulatory factor